MAKKNSCVRRHFVGTVHRDLLELQAAPAVDQEMVCLRNDLIAGGMAVGPGGIEAHIRIHLGIKQPEGNIDALNLLQVVFIGKGLGQYRPVAIVPLLDSVL